MRFTNLEHLWHPCTQMKDYEKNKPLIARAASGSLIELEDGTKVIDAMSSWWCKSLGHGHPRLKAAMIKQMNKFEHIALADITNETIVQLSKKLIRLLPGLNRVFYASDGSSAIEIALKMSLHYRKIDSSPKNKFISLSNSYHGESLGALSVSGIELYNKFYQDLTFKTHFIQDIPYVLSMNDPRWSDCSGIWPRIERQLNIWAESSTAIVVEPILQAAGNMKIYSQDFLYKLSNWALVNDVHLIADEIMTGFGRTGKMFACEHANIVPDFLCVGKGLTSGWLPLSAVITSERIFQQFYDDYSSGKSFLHSHTFSGNALAASIASEVIDIFEEENICHKATMLGNAMFQLMLDIAKSTEKLENIRAIGAVVAGDLKTDRPRSGYDVYQQAVKLGALLRTLGNTIYWVPPLNTDLRMIENLANITMDALLTTTIL